MNTETIAFIDQAKLPTGAVPTINVGVRTTLVYAEKFPMSVTLPAVFTYSPSPLSLVRTTMLKVVNGGKKTVTLVAQSGDKIGNGTSYELTRGSNITLQGYKSTWYVIS